MYGRGTLNGLQDYGLQDYSKEDTLFLQYDESCVVDG